MELNRTEMKSMKTWLKEKALTIRELKEDIKTASRAGYAGDLQSNLVMEKMYFRWNHIAYSMAKGKTYEQIEPSVREDNRPNMNWIYDKLEQFFDTEETA